MQRDLYNNAKNVIGLKTQVISADAANVGEIIDTQGFESALISLVTGVVTTGDIVITSIGESDDAGMSGETNIPAARLFGTATAITASDTVDEIGFVTTKRYVRVTYTSANTASLTCGSVVTLGAPVVASVR